ncbi:MAG: hypothetical protein R2695_00635 [Acidimicrobiales bacterium]
MHDERHIGAFATAYAVGLAMVARRPARAGTMFIVGCALVIALALSTLVDVIEGSVTPTGEAVHVPEVLSLLVLWMLSTPDLERHPFGGRLHELFRLVTLPGSKPTPAG